MKKLLLILALGLCTVSFANEKKTETKVLNYSLVEKNEKGEVLNVKQFDSEEELLRYCVTRTERWYQYTFTGMDGQLYDLYEIREVATCCTV